ncbi:MAG TPA: VanW family protein [Kofleriaceae bacterium]|jgi:vancomycin resistance protein YoaR
MRQRGSVLLGGAGGMLVVAAGLASAYYVTSTRSEARAAPAAEPTQVAPVQAGESSQSIKELLARQVEVKTGTATTKLSWAELGVEVDPDELARAGSADLAALGAKAAIPVRVQRPNAAIALVHLKARYDRSPSDAYLDLEERAIHDDVPGQGIDVWASIPRIEVAARSGAATVELASVPLPASVTKQSLGIADISNVMGHFTTKFPVTDRDRNYNLKLAASKINGTVLQPHQEWSFNTSVGERSEKEGYKIAHVITAGEMVDGLAGGTCQISTTLFGAAFFAGLDIVKTTNHSRPSAYTPLAFDATVVWPDTDLVLKNPYEFPIAIHYRVANGEAVVEILGAKRPWDKIVFARHIEEETPYPSEERLKDDMPDGQTVLAQAGFNGYKLKRYRRFFLGKKLVKEQKWTVQYKPVTEYIERGTDKDPDAKMPPVKEVHSPHIPTSDDFEMAQ